MTVYLAGPWSCKPEVRAARAQFEAAGITVLSDWIDHHPDGTVEPAELRRQAYKDLAQIHITDAFVVLNLEVSEGKASEFMFAYCHQIPCISVGPTPNLFHHMAKVIHVATVEEAINAVHQIRPSQYMAAG